MVAKLPLPCRDANLYFPSTVGKLKGVLLTVGSYKFSPSLDGSETVANSLQGGQGSRSEMDPEPIANKDIANQAN